MFANSCIWNGIWLESCICTARTLYKMIIGMFSLFMLQCPTSPISEIATAWEKEREPPEGGNYTAEESGKLALRSRNSHMVISDAKDKQGKLFDGFMYTASGPERMQQLWLLISWTSFPMKQTLFFILFGRIFIFQQNDTMIISFG